MAAQEALLDAKRELEAARRDVDVLIASRSQVQPEPHKVVQPPYILIIKHRKLLEVESWAHSLVAAYCCSHACCTLCTGVLSKWWLLP